MLFKNNTTFSTDFKFVEKNTSFATIEPHIQDVEDQYISKILGDAQLAALQVAYDASPGTPLSTPNANLLVKCQNVIRNLAMYVGLPKLNLRVSNIGAMKSSSNDYDAASAGEIYFARLQYLIDGYKAIDALWLFLEANKASFSAWTSSVQYQTFKTYFLNTPSAFGAQVASGKNGWLYMQLIPEMENCEHLYIRPALGDALYASLKAKWKAGTAFTAEEQQVFNKLLKPIALYTMSEGIKDPVVREIIRISNAATADELSNKGTLSNDYEKQYNAQSEDYATKAAAYMAHLRNYLNSTATASILPEYFTSGLMPEEPKTLDVIEKYSNDISDSSFAML